MRKKKLAGCAILKGDSLLLLHRTETGVYELPGGKIDEGETPEEAAIRELKEELMCDVDIIKQLGVKDFEEKGFIMPYHWFLAKIQEGQEPRVGEPAKFSHFKYLPLKELEEHPLSSNMKSLLEEIRSGQIKL